MKANLLQTLCSATSLLELETMLVRELKHTKLASGQSRIGFVCGPLNEAQDDSVANAMFASLRKSTEVAAATVEYPVISLADILTPEAYVIVCQDERFWCHIALMLERVFSEVPVTDLFMVSGWNSCPAACQLKKVAYDQIMSVSFMSPHFGFMATRECPGASAQGFWIDSGNQSSQQSSLTA